MDGLGDHLLARTALALNQNGRPARSNLCDQVENLQHDLAFAHNVREVVALLQGALELQNLFFGAMAGHCGADIGQQLFVVPGLLNEVLRAGADGLDNVVHRAIRGDHDDRQLGVAFLDLRKQLEAAFAGQVQVEQQQIEVLKIESPQPFDAVGGHSHRVPLKGQQHFERLADGRLVVDD